MNRMQSKSGTRRSGMSRRLARGMAKLHSANAGVQEDAGQSAPSLHAYGLTRAQLSLFRRTLKDPLPLPREGGEWFVLWVAPGAEFLTLNTLYRRGVPAFVAQKRGMRKKSRTSAEMVSVVRPVITQLIFMHAEDAGAASAMLHRISTIRGVFSRDGIRMAGVDSGSFWAFMALNGWDVLSASVGWSELSEGQQVRVVDGPFEEHKVIFQGVENGLATVRAALFGSERSVIVPLSTLRPL